METPSAFSSRCSRFFLAVKVNADISDAEFNWRCGFGDEFSMSFWRLLRGHKSTIWTPKLAEMAASASSELIGLPFEQIWGYLNGQKVEHSNRLREIEISRSWFPRPTQACLLGQKLQKYEQKAKTIVGVQRFLPASLMDEPIYTPFYHYLTANWGDFGRRARTVMRSFAFERRLQFQDNGAPGSEGSKVLIMLSEFDRAMAMQGPLEGVKPDAVYDCVISLMDAIAQTSYGIILIDDARLPENVAEHYSYHDAVVAFDRDFVMKINRRSMVRNWCERCAGADHVLHIDHELAMMNELLKYRAHDLTKPAMTEALKKYLPD